MSSAQTHMQGKYSYLLNQNKILKKLKPGWYIQIEILQRFWDKEKANAVLEKYRNTDHFICAHVNLIIQKLWFKCLSNITLLFTLYAISFKRFYECLFSDWYVAEYPGPISSETPKARFSSPCSLTCLLIPLRHILHDLEFGVWPASLSDSVVSTPTMLML